MISWKLSKQPAQGVPSASQASTWQSHDQSTLLQRVKGVRPLARRARQSRRLFLVLGNALVLLSLTAVGGESPEYAVSRVLAGGGVVLRLEGRDMVARLIGVEYEGPTVALEGELRGPVTLVLQPGRAVDTSGTPLVELFRGGRSLNEQVVWLGLARVGRESGLAPRLLERLQIAQREAREAGRGLWQAPLPTVAVLATEPMSAEPPSSEAPFEPVVPSPLAPALAPELTLPAVAEPQSEPEEVSEPDVVQTLSSPPAVRVELASGSEPAAALVEPPAPAALPFPLIDDSVAAANPSGVLVSSLSWIWSLATLPGSMDSSDLVLTGLARVAFASFGAWIAFHKRRRVGEGLVLGVAFGPLGVLVEALLPLAALPTFPRSQAISSQPNLQAMPQTPVVPTLRHTLGLAQPIGPAPPGSSAFRAESDSICGPISSDSRSGSQPTYGLGSHDMIMAGSDLWEHYEDLPVDHSLMQDDDDQVTTEGSGSGLAGPPSSSAGASGSPVPAGEGRWNEV